MASSTQNNCPTCGIPASMRVPKWIAEPESWLEELNLNHIRQRVKLEDKVKILEAENRVLAADKRVALAQKAVIEEECKFCPLSSFVSSEKLLGRRAADRLSSSLCATHQEAAAEEEEEQEERRETSHQR